VPRVQPTRSRFRDDEIVRAWQAFGIDLGNVPFTIRRGTRLRADHEVVQAAPWNFVRSDATDDEIPSEYPTLPEQEAPRFTKPTRVRVRCRVLHGSAAYEKGHIFEAPPTVAEWLVGEGYAAPE
jgi:hypothetical protein